MSNERKYPRIDETRDKQYLYDNLPEKQLCMIEDVLNAYGQGRIDIEIPRYEDDGTVDFCGEFEIIINDSSYVCNGFEIMIIKWIEDFEDTGYMVECLQDI